MAKPTMANLKAIRSMLNICQFVDDSMLIYVSRTAKFELGHFAYSFLSFYV